MREYPAHSKLSRGAIQKAERNGRMVLYGARTLSVGVRFKRQRFINFDST